MWRKSSYSMNHGNCLEWRTSSYSLRSDCVELAPGILVRDSRLGDSGPVLRFTPAAWGKFITGIKEERENDR